MKENMLVDKRVHHIVYGEGLVISQTPRKDSNSFYLEVKFGEIVKKFIFPDALHKYLEFVDSEDIALFVNQEMNLSNTKEQKGDKWIFRCAETACPEDWKPRVRTIGNRFQHTLREALCAEHL